MSSDAEVIIAELREAFPAIRPHRFTTLVNSDQGDEPLEVAAAFENADDWTKLAPDWLDAVPSGLSSALSFLSDEAIRFYIPAYLAADLIGALNHVDPASSLVHGFDEKSRGQRVWPRTDATWTDLARARWDDLTWQQAIAIVHYLEWRGQREDDGITEALATYWHGRAAPR